jgi:FG-GAP-like repeat
VDVFLSNVAFLPGKNPQNRLYLNNGAGHFSDATATNLPTDNFHTIDAIFEDTDLDGDLDLLLGNVFGGPLKIYQNNGSGVFGDATTDVLGQDYYLDALGLIAADLNGDGLRDLYICHRQTPQNSAKDLLLLRNVPVSTKNNASKEPFVLLYPNPASDFLFIRAGAARIDSIQLFELDGRKVADLQNTQVSDGIFKCTLPKATFRKGGTYTVEIQLKKKTVRRVLFVG